MYKPNPSEAKFYLISGLAVFTASCADSGKEKETQDKAQPNIVMILADDLGWSQLGCYGSDYYETPVIDSLASEGMRFTQAYSAAAISSPTRASLMTGKHPARLNLTDFIAGGEFPDKPLQQPDWQKFLKLNETSIGEVAKERGYATALYGKWHLSKDKLPPESLSHNPQKQGFDDDFVTYKPSGRYKKEWQQAGDDAHSVDTITQRSIEFVEENIDNPFFLIVSHNTIHDPLMEHDTLVDYFEQKKGAQDSANNPVIGAMIKRLDRSVRKILNVLDQNELNENTIVIFYSDNGGKEAHADQYPLKAGKGWLYEGGIRVPLIVKWPGVVKAGKMSDALVTSNDFYSTFAELMGADTLTEEIDGQSFLPVLKGKKNDHHKALFWHYPHYHWGSGMRPGGAVRKGNYKLVIWYNELLREKKGAFELYNLKHDPGEQNNLFPEMQDKGKELFMEFKEWQNEVNAQMPEIR